MPSPDRSDKFAYTHPDQIVTDKRKIARSKQLRSLRRLIEDEDLSVERVIGLVRDHLDELRSDGEATSSATTA